MVAGAGGDVQLWQQQLMTMISERIDRIETTQERLATAVERQAAGLEKVAVLLAKHEEHSNAIGRAFDEIEACRADHLDQHRDHESRLRKVEEEMPTLKLTRGWVISFTLAGFSLLALAVAALVLK